LTATPPGGGAGSAIGLDVGGTKILGIVLDAGGAVVEEARRPTPGEAAPLMAAMVEMVAAFRVGLDQPDDVVVGVGVPGLVDRAGTLRFGPNLPGIHELAVGRLGAEATGVAWRVDNDATAALWAEHRLGAARGVDDALLVTLGTGIGGGLLADGRLVRGAHGFAGEVGHMVVAVGGLPCPCGREGCWERYASGSGLGRLGREAAEAGRGTRMTALAGGDALQVRGEHVTAAAAEGDAEAGAVVATFADWFAVGLANLVHVLDVDRCIVGGGLAASGPTLLEPVRRAFLDRVVAPDHRPVIEIVPAALGPRAGAIGAALLARQ
jgi:glucokinase